MRGGREPSGPWILGGCVCVSRQEAEQELLARVQPTLGSVGRGYNVALLLRGRETEAPRLVPQLLQMLFEEALPPGGSDLVFSTLSLVQLSPSGGTQDLLSPVAEHFSVLDVAPLGLVVENATEVEVSDSRAATELYLQATVGEGRDCPLLQVLAGKAADEQAEGSLPWIVSWLLEGNNYKGILLRLDPQGSSLSLLQAALLGAAGRRMRIKQVKPTLWDAAEEARARRAGLKSLRSGLLGVPLTDRGLSRLGRALRELQVVKAWSRHPEGRLPKGVRAEAAAQPESQHVDFPLLISSRQAINSEASPGLQGEPPVAGRAASLGPGLHQKHTLGDSEEQVPDVALQFLLAKARRQRVREQHRLGIQEELKHLHQEEAGDQVKGLVAEETSTTSQRWHREQAALRLQLEALRVERDTAEQDLIALYDLHVQATRAQTCHLLQVFRAWRGLCEERTKTTEHQHRHLLADILQDTIHLAAQNQELQAQNRQLRQVAD
ncbi:uncharacterized protein LOC119051108 [Artibeus jamaicensis]|uniref:uncharacterized protein LOC119051108 n=1 Tax=Artibeus jamaicensis TaxID=9417 RepID=UPI00235A8FB5|nr:uncharacterized protein LOC119051108 [Artibeus jamaicensis]